MATRSTNGKFAKPPDGVLAERSGMQKPSRNRIVHIPPYLEGVKAALDSQIGPDGLIVRDNPMMFPGYDRLYTGSYETYRWMLQHPIIRLVRSIRIGIIAANTWEYEAAEKDVNPEWVEYTKTTFDRLRPDLIWDYMARGHDYGWQGGEPIWEPGDAELRLERVKPLLVDVTEVLRDKHGTFTGLRNNIVIEGQTTPPELGAPYKAWKFTYDGEADYPYGRSWLENLRATAWRMWLDCAQDLHKIGNKISGTIGIIFSPAGTFPGPIDEATGKPKAISYKENAETVFKALGMGAIGAWFPSLSLSPDTKGNLDAMKVLVELAGKSLTHFEKFDFTAQATAIKSILERMIHAEQLMFAGGLRSARVGMEGQHGTKAEAGEHTDTGTINAEADEESFARQVQPLVDCNLILNRSAKARGKVRIKPTSLVDRKTAIYKAVLLSLAQDKIIAQELAATPGVVKSLMRVLDITGETDFSVENLQKRIGEELKARQKPGPEGDDKKTPEPEGGRTPKKEE
jgi:hypothetical protein